MHSDKLLRSNFTIPRRLLSAWRGASPAWDALALTTATARTTWVRSPRS